jgi:hypothetical protein
MIPILGIMASSISGSKAITGAFESIATATGTGTAASLQFTSIPSTYKHLQIRYCIRGYDTTSRTYDDLRIRFNNDTTNANYYGHYLIGNGVTAYADSLAGVSVGGAMIISSYLPGADAAANIMAVGVIDILDYASTTKNKTTRFVAGNDRNSAEGSITLGSVGYFSTTAISSIQLLPDPTGFTTTSTFALYGIK